MQTAQTQLENKSLTTTCVGSTLALPSSVHPSPPPLVATLVICFITRVRNLLTLPRATHKEGCNTSWPRGVCAPPAPSLSLSLLPFPFAHSLIPFVKCFLRYYYVCLPICRLGLAHKLPARHRLTVHKSAASTIRCATPHATCRPLHLFVCDR